MHYKIEGTIRKNKSRFIIFAILWLFMTIVIVMPISYGIHLANVNGSFDIGKFIDGFVRKLYQYGKPVSESLLHMLLISLVFFGSLRLSMQYLCL